MLSMSWITAILQLYSQVADLFGNVIVKRINIRLFDLLARFHYILNLPRTYILRKSGHGYWRTGINRQWRKTGAVSRTVLLMSIPDLDSVYQHSF